MKCEDCIWWATKLVSTYALEFGEEGDYYRAMGKCGWRKPPADCPFGDEACFTAANYCCGHFRPREDKK